VRSSRKPQCSGNARARLEIGQGALPGFLSQARGAPARDRPGISVGNRLKDVTAPSAHQELARSSLDIELYFCNYRNMPVTQSKKSIENIARYADMFSAMGTEPRLRIMQLLLSAHPDGLIVGEIQEELDIPNSTLSHHLDKLKAEGLVHIRRESTFLHYTANTEALQELLQFLYAECCTRNKAVKPKNIVQICE
jgi:ArsR family transcriptional regulator, arsenate/arsenite/antimonite-responsive transcriptional repressor